MSALTVGGMFAGYGGLEVAVRAVYPQARPAWFCQYDPEGGKRQAPSHILAHHWPDVPNHGDVTAIDWAAVEPVDILTGGFPCTDVSTAGKRAGLKSGTRSGLWSHMAAAVDTIRPRLVVIENVRGLLSAEADSDVEPCPWCLGAAGDGEPPVRALGAVLADLADVGYDAAWVGLRAADVGAPHGRFRIFVIAWPQSDPSALTWPQSDPSALTWPQSDPSALLPTPAVNDMGASYTPDEWDAWTDRMRAEHGNGNGHGASLSIEALRLLPTPRTTDTNGAGSHGEGGDDLRTVVSLLPTPTKTNASGNGHNSRGEQLLPGVALSLLPTPTTEPNTGNGHARYLGGEVRDLLPTPQAHDAATPKTPEQIELMRERGYGVANLNETTNFGQYAPAVARWEALTRPAPSPTEPTGKEGAHRLSSRFVEFMMGLPDGWVTDVPGITRNDMLKALGNGVVPQQAAEGIRWLTATVRAHLDTERVA